jgi:hypothetical protein
VPKLPNRRRRTGLTSPSSGVDLTPESRVHDVDDDGSTPWETVVESYEGVSDRILGRRSFKAMARLDSSTPESLENADSAHSSETCSPRDVSLMFLAGPGDAMTSLPIEATRENAMLVNICTCLTP